MAEKNEKNEDVQDGKGCRNIFFLFLFAVSVCIFIILFIGLDNARHEISELKETLATTERRINKIVQQTDKFQKNAALIQSLSSDTASPYRKYYDAMENLRRLAKENSHIRDPLDRRELSEIEDRLDELDDRLGELDGESNYGSGFIIPFGGRRGKINQLQDQVDDLERSVNSIERSVKNIEFDLIYDR